MTISLKADPGGAFGIIQVGGVDKIRINSDGSLVALSPVDKTDATAGRLLQVGDFGIGGDSARVNGTDLNTLTKAGFYSGDALVNAPADIGSNYAYIHVQAHSLTYNKQTLTQIAGYAGTRTYERTSINNAWQSWRRVYNQEGILGTVSQLAGVPTGAIIERGSNANGGYIKFADGTMICILGTHTVTGTGWTATATSIKYSAIQTWTLPSSFISTPVFNVAIREQAVSSRSAWVTNSTGGASSCTFYLASVSAATATTDIPVGLIAIGHWF